MKMDGKTFFLIALWFFVNMFSGCSQMLQRQLKTQRREVFLHRQV